MRRLAALALVLEAHPLHEEEAQARFDLGLHRRTDVRDLDVGIFPGDDLQGRGLAGEIPRLRPHQPAAAEEEPPRPAQGLDDEGARLALQLQELEEGGQGDVLHPPLHPLGQQLADPCLEVRHVERLGEALHRAVQAVGRLGAAQGRHHDHRQAGEVAPQVGQQLEAVHLGHPQVGEHEVDPLGFEQGDGLHAAGGGRHLDAAPPVA